MFILSYAWRFVQKNIYFIWLSKIVKSKPSLQIPWEKKNHQIEESKLKMFQVLLTGKRAKTTWIENENEEKACKVHSAGKKLDSKVLEKSAKMPSKSTCNGEKIGLKMFRLIVSNPFRKW